MESVGVLGDHVQFGALEPGHCRLVYLVLREVGFPNSPVVLEVVQRITELSIRSNSTQSFDIFSQNTGRW